MTLFENKVLFQSVLGSLLYLACWSRPDICTVVHLLYQKYACPYNKAWVAAKRVLRYLKGTAMHKLILGTMSGPQLTANSDARWSDAKDGKSTMHYAVYVHGALVMWKSLKQTHVSTSICEAEFSALSDCIIQFEWMYQLMSGTLPVYVHCDNTAA